MYAVTKTPDRFHDQASTPAAVERCVCEEYLLVRLCMGRCGEVVFGKSQRLICSPCVGLHVQLEQAWQEFGQHEAVARKYSTGNV